VLLGLAYAGIVLGLGRLVGRDATLVVAAATLAVAAAFQPLRRRVQAFAARLRDQVDLDALHGELLAVVDQTMQPTRALAKR
jgi:hypothetical protein